MAIFHAKCLDGQSSHDPERTPYCGILSHFYCGILSHFLLTIAKSYLKCLASLFPKIWWETQNSVKDHVTRTAPSSRVECHPLHMDYQCTKSFPSFSTSSVSMYSLTTDHMFHFIFNIIPAHFVRCLTVQFHLPPSRYNHWPNQHQITISTNQKHMNALFLVMTTPVILDKGLLNGCGVVHHHYLSAIYGHWWLLQRAYTYSVMATQTHRCQTT